MVLGGFYKYTKEFTISIDRRYKNKTNFVGIPTDGKTTPYYLGGYKYSRLGGNSSAIPYIAGIFALALQNNQTFCLQLDWQTKLMNILVDTAIETKQNGKIINPEGIVQKVSEITNELNLSLIKNKKIINE